MINSSKKYNMPSSEVQALVEGLMTMGLNKTYDRVRERAFSVLEDSDLLDTQFMDRADHMLYKARSEGADSEDETNAREIYYTIASMLRRIAHEIHREYHKQGRANEDKRFLKLVVNNTDIGVRV